MRLRHGMPQPVAHSMRRGLPAQVDGLCLVLDIGLGGGSPGIPHSIKCRGSFGRLSWRPRHLSFGNGNVLSYRGRSTVSFISKPLYSSLSFMIVQTEASCSRNFGCRKSSVERRVNGCLSRPSLRRGIGLVSTPGRMRARPQHQAAGPVLAGPLLDGLMSASRHILSGDFGIPGGAESAREPRHFQRSIKCRALHSGAFPAISRDQPSSLCYGKRPARNGTGFRISMLNCAGFRTKPGQ